MLDVIERDIPERKLERLAPCTGQALTLGRGERAWHYHIRLFDGCQCIAMRNYSHAEAVYDLATTDSADRFYNAQ